MKKLVQTTGLFVLPAITEIVDCYLPYLWLRQDKSAWLYVPAALSLAAFAWLLMHHQPSALQEMGCRSPGCATSIR